MIAYAFVLVYGAVMFALGVAYRRSREIALLPPATVRQMARAARASRADLRLVRWTYREPAGVVPIGIDRFDTEDTQP